MDLPERPLKSMDASRKTTEIAKEGASEAERALRRWALEGELVKLNRENATIKHRLVGKSVSWARISYDLASPGSLKKNK